MGLFDTVLLTVDYDRTLTGPDSTIPQRNLDAIRYFMENGGAFTVNTGRSLPMTRFFPENLEVNAPLLLYNGSLAYDLKTKQVLNPAIIQLDQAATIRRVMELLPDMAVEMQGLESHYLFAKKSGWDDATYGNSSTWTPAQPEDNLGPFIKFAVYGYLHSNTVAALYEGTAEEFARFDEAEQILLREFGDHCEVFRAAPKILDVHAKGVSKANAARMLQKYLGREILVCAGDGENDLSMMHDADFAFAPQDAIIAKQFPNVCPCGEGAVADVIYEKIPEILKIRLDK